MGNADFTSNREGEISHGMCPECYKKVTEGIPKDREK